MITNGSLSHTLDRMLTLNRALDQALASSWSGAHNRGRVWVPAVDIVERMDAYVVAMEAPGVDPAAMDISFEQNVLTIRGSKPLAIELPKDDQVRIHSAERATGNFERSIRLPESVDSEKISAESRDGLLVLTVPKAPSARARKIQIKGVEQKQVSA